MPKKNQSRRRPTAIDMFCGCGGTTLGLEQAGFRVIAGVDVREEAAATYRLNHPAAELFYDIRYLTPKFLMETLGLKKGQLDLLSGCPPCQGFSTMRTLNALSASRDDRNNLVFDFLRLVDGLRPRAVLIENVPGLSQNWRFIRLRSELRKLGYAVQHGVFNSASFGVPQRRKRLVVCAVRGKRPLTLQFAPTPQRTVRQAIGALPTPKKSTNPLHKMASSHSAKVKRRISLIPHNGGSRKDLGKRAQLSCHREEDTGFHDVYGRMAWDEVSPTITRYSNNPSKGRFLHPKQNRAISLLEAALLQSFPRSYKFPKTATLTQVASMIGEAFPPRMAKSIARRIHKHLAALAHSSRTRSRHREEVARA